MKNHHLIPCLMLLALAVIITVGLVGCGRPAARPKPTATLVPPTVPPTDTPQPTATQAVPTDGLKPLPSTGEVDSIPVGFTQDGHAYRGNPNAAVVIVEYSEFQCPFCGRHERTTAPQIKEIYLKSGKVLHIFRDFPLESIHGQARKAAEAARCAAEQGAERFWAMHDLLFERVGQWAEQPDAVERFKSYAQELELDSIAFDECLDSGRTSPAIDADLAAGEAQGVEGTPTFFLNNYPLVGAQPFTIFQAAIDTLLAGKPLPTPEPPEARIPYWATAEGMSPDPDRPGYTKAGDAFMGDAKAEVILIEFSDFQ